MADKCTIINEEGFALKNLPNNKFIDAKSKNTVPWTFSLKNVNLESGTYSTTIQKALAQLEAAGFKNLRVVRVDQQLENDQDEKQAKAQVTKGTKQPRTQAESEEICKKAGIDLNLEENYLFKEINHKCVPCANNTRCPQSSKAVIYSCGAYKAKEAGA